MRQLVLTLCLILGATQASAQTLTMATVLRTMPDSLLPLLTPNDRLDLVDYAQANQTAHVTNRLRGTTTLTTLTDDYACLRLTSMSEARMRLFATTEGDTILCLATTCETADSLADTALTFYALPTWSSVPISVVRSPKVRASDYCQLTLAPDTPVIHCIVRRPNLAFDGHDNTIQTIFDSEVQWNGRQFVPFQ